MSTFVSRPPTALAQQAVSAGNNIQATLQRLPAKSHASGPTRRDAATSEIIRKKKKKKRKENRQELLRISGRNDFSNPPPLQPLIWPAEVLANFVHCPPPPTTKGNNKQGIPRGSVPNPPRCEESPTTTSSTRTSAAPIFGHQSIIDRCFVLENSL